MTTITPADSDSTARSASIRGTPVVRCQSARTLVSVVGRWRSEQTGPMIRDAQLARRLWSCLESIHAVTYFSPEPLAALADAGYKGFWMGYFAGRAAPMGRVGPEMVFATFYNFSMAHVRRALPDGWTFAPPSAALEARQAGSVLALERAFADRELAESVATAAMLARAAAESAPMEGRTLFAANRSLPWPEDPTAVLWHAATLLREHRGDGHVSALTTAGIHGREANVLQSAAGVVPREVFAVARRYDDGEWASISARLVGRGLLDRDGKLTPQGEAIRAGVEGRTDALALSAYNALDDEQLHQLMDALVPLARAVIASGDIPDVTPIGERFEV
jgi:Helix-turn-helix family